MALAWCGDRTLPLDWPASKPSDALKCTVESFGSPALLVAADMVVLLPTRDVGLVWTWPADENQPERF